MNTDAKVTLLCPECKSINIHREGHHKERIKGTHFIRLIQNYRCYDCLRQFSEKINKDGK
jgi:transposase-like protein